LFHDWLCTYFKRRPHPERIASIDCLIAATIEPNKIIIIMVYTDHCFFLLQRRVFVFLVVLAIFISYLSRDKPLNCGR
jgi:hypothetical protein